MEKGENSLCVLYLKGQQGTAVSIFLSLFLLSGYLWWHDLFLLSFFLKKKQIPKKIPKSNPSPHPETKKKHNLSSTTYHLLIKLKFFCFFSV